MATGNPHKAERFKHYLTPLGFSVITFADLKENFRKERKQIKINNFIKNSDNAEI